MASIIIHAPLAIAAGAVFIFVDFVVVAGRLYARHLQGSRWGADDWTIVAALPFVVVMGAVLIWEVSQHRLGYPQEISSAANGRPDANVAFWPLELLQVPALGFTKASVVLLYRRVFAKSGTGHKFNIITWTVLLLIAGWTLSFFLSLVFICNTDFSAYWASTVIESRMCVRTSPLHNALSISDFILDVIIIALPFPLIRHLHLHLHQSIPRTLGILATFLVGLLTVAASALRMAVFLQATSVQYKGVVDYEFLCTNGIYWSLIEAGLSVCVACLPVYYYYFAGHTRTGLSSAVRSGRSAFSLDSISYVGSGRLDDGPDTDAMGRKETSQ